MKLVLEINFECIKGILEIISLLEPRLSSVNRMQIIMNHNIFRMWHLSETGDLCGISKVTDRACIAICELRRHYINFSDAQANYKVGTILLIC